MPKATPSRDRNRFDAEPLKWGILATGGIARKFVSDLHASKSGRAVACGSRTIEGARSFAAEYGIPKAYGSYGELARDPEVEAVYIATPHPFHYQDTLACLRSKKHVLCEKPMTLNARQSAALFAAAEENGVFLMEALWTYFLPAVVQARRWVAEGAIGEVKLIHADFGFQAVYNPAGRHFDPALGGGSLLDVGIYPLSFAQMFAGSKTPRIKATARMAPTNVDESASVLLDWNSGVRAHLSSSLGHQLPNTGRIYGSEGTITIPDFWMARSAVLEAAGTRQEFTDHRTTWGYEFEAQAMTQAVREGRTEDPLITKAFSLRLATTMDAVRKQIGLVYPGDDA